MSEIPNYPVVHEHPYTVPCSLCTESPWVRVTVLYPARRSKRIKARKASLDGLLAVPLHGFGHGRRESE